MLAWDRERMTRNLARDRQALITAKTQNQRDIYEARIEWIEAKMQELGWITPARPPQSFLI